MGNTSFRLSGTKASLEHLRSALLAEAQAANLIVTEPAVQPEPADSAEVRVRQPWELAEAIWLMAVTFPIGVGAEIAGKRVDDWLREWLKSRADRSQVRVQEVSAHSVPEPTGRSGVG